MGAFLPPPGQPDPKMDPTFRSGSFPAVTTFSFDKIGPPSPLYIQRDDVLAVLIDSEFANDTITIQGRALLAPFPRGGQPDQATPRESAATSMGTNIIEPLSFPVLSSAAVRIAVWRYFPLAEGYLLSLAAFGGSAIQRGQTYIRVFLNRGSQPQSSAGAFVPLFSGYVSQFSVIGWPFGRTQDPSEGLGVIKSVNVANPAAGADWTFATSTQTRTRLQSVNAQLLTSAIAANRIPRVRITDLAGNIVWQSGPQQSIPASTTAQVSIGQGQITSVVDTTSVNITLPGLAYLPAGWNLLVNTLALQAGDQWSNIWLALEQLFDNV